MQVRYNKMTKQPFGHNTVAIFLKKKNCNIPKIEHPMSFTTEGNYFRRTAEYCSLIVVVIFDN